MNPTPLTGMVDRVLSDRYRLDELIGVGAISAVYAAYDLIDNRRVAAKVFHEALAADDRFVERLLDAVEQAAVLGHPNIVEIIDWGDDSGPYVVSELCEGGSLAALLAAGHTLTASQALVMTLECARALNYGHEQGAIHRNITPNNVLFSDDQRVRIADYGIAKVLADAPVSQAARALENVRYASPEQARGRPVGEASDLYSLALVVNEAVSAVQPVVAETVVGTLMERAEAAADLDPGLEGLLPPLERCGRVDPDERPEAEELSIALLAAAETMARPEAFPLVGIEDLTTAGPYSLMVSGGSEPPIDEFSGAGDLVPDQDQGDLVSFLEGDGQGDRTAAHPDDDAFDVSVLGPLDETDLFADDEFGDDNQLDETDSTDDAHAELVDHRPALRAVESSALGGLENLEQADPVFADVPGATIDTELDVPEVAPAARAAKLAYEETVDDADDQLPWWPLVLLGLLVAGAVGAGVYFFALSDSAESAEVPNLIGVAYDDLEQVVGDRGWQIETLENRVNDSVVGSIVAQAPAAGTELEEGGVLSVTVSLGNEMVEIPSDIVGLTVAQATSRLGEVGLALGDLAEENSEELEAGLVIGLDEPTTQKPTGQGVSLRISLGPQARQVPESVLGLPIGDATILLTSLRLQAVEEPAYSPDAELGIVLATIPLPGEIVPADSAVTLIVSAGPEPVVMPDIIGLALDEAIDELEALGLIFVDTNGTPGEDAIGSLPPIGATVDVGTEVTIILDDPAEDDEGADEADDN